MGAIKKADVNPLASIKSIIQSSFVEWSINTGSTSWPGFVTANTDSLKAPLVMAISYGGVSNRELLELTTHSAGILSLCVRFDFISGYEKAIASHLTMIQKSREHERDMAAENQTVISNLLSAGTRTVLGKNIDSSVAILAAELATLRTQYSKDAELIDAWLHEMRTMEQDDEFLTVDPDEEAVYTQEYRAMLSRYTGLAAKVKTTNARKQSAITRANEITMQLQGTIAAFDQLNTSLAGLVDSTYNYMNPEITYELTTPPSEPHPAPNDNLFGSSGEISC